MLDSKLKPSGPLFLVPECPFAVIVTDGKTGSLLGLDEVLISIHVSLHKTLAHIIAHSPHTLRPVRVIGALCASDNNLILIEEGIGC